MQKKHNFQVYLLYTIMPQNIFYKGNFKLNVLKQKLKINWRLNNSKEWMGQRTNRIQPMISLNIITMS